MDQKPKRKSPKLSQSNAVDIALRKLSDDEIDEFKLEIVRYPLKPDFPAMMRWLAEKGHPVPRSTLGKWYRQNYPTGESAKAMNAIFAAYQNVDPAIALGGSIGILAQNVDALGQLLKNAGTKANELEINSVTQLIYAYNTQSGMVGRMADIAERLQQEHVVRTKREYTLAGAAQLAAIVTEELKDTPAEAAVRLAIQAAIARMEEEAIK